MKDSPQDFFGDFGTPRQSVFTFHQNFRLDYRDHARLLAKCRVAGQSLGIGVDASPTRDVIADGNHGTPLGKTRAYWNILLEAVPQAVQTFSDFLSGVTGHFLGTLIDLDPRDDPRVDKNPKEGPAVFGLLADRFVKKDGTADAFAQAGRGDHHLTVGPLCSSVCGMPSLAKRLLQVGVLSSMANSPLSWATSVRAVSTSIF